jgi:hypothetical protein
VLGSNPSQLAAGDAAVVRLKPLSTPLCVEAFEVPRGRRQLGPSSPFKVQSDFNMAIKGYN